MDADLGAGEWQDSGRRMRAALTIAGEFLSRWTDRVTESEREDLLVEAAVLAVRGFDRLRDKDRFPAYVRTIARRRRAAAVRLRLREERAGLYGTQPRLELPAPRPDPVCYRVAGRPVHRDELLAALPALFARLEPLNVELLRGFYEGFSYAELAGRFDLSLDVAKVRVHRTRRRIKRMLERMAERGTCGSGAGTLPSPRPAPTTTDGV